MFFQSGCEKCIVLRDNAMKPSSATVRTRICKMLRIVAVLWLAIFLPAVSAIAKKKPPDHPIDLNVANEKELEELPGVGPTTAKAIIDFREKSGHFKRVEDLLTIRGISETKLQKMKPYLTIGPGPTAKPAAVAHSTVGSSAAGPKPVQPSRPQPAPQNTQ